jgi:SIR2-like domain
VKAAGDEMEPKSWRKFDFARLGSGPLYFYVGAGLSMSAAGLVGWAEMAWLIWLYRTKYEGAAEEPPGRTAKKLGSYLQSFLAEPEDGCQILSRDSKSPKALGRAVLLNLMLRYRGPRFELFLPKGAKEPVPKITKHRPRPGAEPSAEDLTLHSLVWRSRCHGVLTTNYDMLLEHAYSLYQHGAALRSYRYNANLLRYLLSNPRFVLKLHGDINDLATMEFDPDAAWVPGAPFRNRYGGQLKEVYHAILQRGQMIYIGCGFQDATIRELHKFHLRKRRRRGDTTEQRSRPVALVPDSLQLRTRFDEIEFLTYPRGRYREVREFLEQIVDARSDLEDTWQACAEASDIRMQVFRPTSPELRLRQNLSTEPWTCKAHKPRGKSKRRQDAVAGGLGAGRRSRPAKGEPRA